MTSKKIKEASLELIAERGYCQTTLSLIAERVGIKKPSIYSHFQSKEDIFFSILEDETKNLNIYIENIYYDIKKYELEEMLYLIIYKFAEYFNNNMTLAKFWSLVMYFPPYSLEQEFKFDITKYKIYECIYRNIKEKTKNKKLDEEKMKNIMHSYEVILRGILTMIIYDSDFTIEKIDQIIKVYFNGIKNELTENLS
ncbi:TetR/AcrR family transcriptional regulator [Tepidibacter hydrothermalis]|uniref:TetR/AcrR family transcriptional regulator n=1 Tax=Tepidibacter hydrothermalis TaxID=3036126 RepID=A0ABY8ED17_9FIRM|nr:TetR/AcrR family transcriptional regulator [Tepidibacter hydrothermalis]WFD10833.1 TetR/AcrR family transcriptional regulator [Tepidibacter hydrothermalis]